jgi:putative addiction module component (TIGR02574 family)
MAKKDDVLSSALELTAKERAEIARRLLLSLEDEPQEDPATVAAAWEMELQKRLDDVRSGRVKGRDGFEMLEASREWLRKKHGA